MFFARGLGKWSGTADKQFEALLAASHPSSVLLWLDLLDDGLIVRDDALEWLVTTLTSFGARTATTLLITSDETSRHNAEDIVDQLGFSEANECDIGEQTGPEGVEAVSKHAEAIRLKMPEIETEVLDGFEFLAELRGGLEKHLPAAVPIAAMYIDDDGGMIVRLCVSDVLFLHQLASVVLTGAPVIHQLCIVFTAFS